MRLVGLYKGSFLYDKREGFGTFLSPSGLEYEGEWKDDKQHGKGKKKWPDGDMYEGECRGGANHDCIPVIDTSCWFVQRIFRQQQEKRFRGLRFAFWSRI